jgi:CheY-like chemotaxis protein
MEEKLQHAAKMESVGLLAGGIAHDFNNILTVILSNLSLLQLDLAGMPEEATLLDEAVRATKRAAELTLQLLTFSKGGDPVRTAVRLNDIVQEAANFARRGSGVRSEFEIPADLWTANVDKAQISQVVQNLVINAIQAMPQGGTLRIGASNERLEPDVHPVLGGGDYVRISVADTGAGIPPENLGRIFDPYFTTKLLGHGLGLATVFSIVKRHQGHIEVASALGQGTTFTFWLSAAPALQLEPVPSEVFAGADQGGRVLFMDDEEPILLMAEKLMRRMGLEFESAAHGEGAIQLYQDAMAAGRPFDLVVMDLTIPGGMGGREAISMLRQIDPAVRAIVSSGYSSDLAMADFRKHGFRGMVAKPYDVTELASVIRNVLKDQAPVGTSGDSAGK